ncbi:MAG TPA: hypothetical protein VN632_07655 [Stellaceae bacterium]|nr:hypothetical protein [Stellaceae bacterium]
MRRVLLLMPLLLWAGAATAADVWTYFADPAGAFTIAVPATPVTQTAQLPGPNGKKLTQASYIVERSNGALVVVVIDLTPLPDNPRALDDAVGNVKGAAASGLSDTPIAQDGLKGHDIRFKDKDGNQFEDRMFYAGRKIYQVMTVEASGIDAASHAVGQRFLASMHFIKH